MTNFSAGTQLLYNRASRNSGRPITAGDLHSKYNGLGCKTRPWQSTAPTRLHSYSEATRAISYTTVSAVQRLGTQQMISILLEGIQQRITIGTASYLRTRRRLLQAPDIQSGLYVMCKGTMLPSGGSGRIPRHRQDRITVEGLKYHPDGWHHHVFDKKTGRTYQYERKHRARLVVEAEMNGLDYENYIWFLRNDPASRTFRFIPRDYQVHHIDGDCTNDAISNLSVVTSVEHARLHGLDQRRFNINYTSMKLIVDVEAVARSAIRIQLEDSNNIAACHGLIVFGS